MVTRTYRLFAVMLLQRYTKLRGRQEVKSTMDNVEESPYCASFLKESAINRKSERKSDGILETSFYSREQMKDTKVLK